MRRQAVQNILNADSMTTVLSALSFISTMLRDNATRECFAGVSLKQIIDIAEKWPDVPYQIAVASVLGNVSKSTKVGRTLVFCFPSDNGCPVQVRNEYKWYRYLRLVEHFLEQESLDVQQEALHILVNLCDSEEVQRSMIGMRLLEYTMKAVRKGVAAARDQRIRPECSARNHGGAEPGPAHPGPAVRRHPRDPRGPQAQPHHPDRRPVRAFTPHRLPQVRLQWPRFGPASPYRPPATR